jgi:hypothetical protein
MRSRVRSKGGEWKSLLLVRSVGGVSVARPLGPLSYINKWIRERGLYICFVFPFRKYCLAIWNSFLKRSIFGN